MQFYSQIVVSFVATLLLLDIGLSISYPAVLISALTGLNTESNPDETLRMTDVESSWMGTITKHCHDEHLNILKIMHFQVALVMWESCSGVYRVDLHRRILVAEIL